MKTNMYAVDRTNVQLLDCQTWLPFPSNIQQLRYMQPGHVNSKVQSTYETPKYVIKLRQLNKFISNHAYLKD